MLNPTVARKGASLQLADLHAGKNALDAPEPRRSCARRSIYGSPRRWRRRPRICPPPRYGATCVRLVRWS